MISDDAVMRRLHVKHVSNLAAARAGVDGNSAIYTTEDRRRQPAGPCGHYAYRTRLTGAKKDQRSRMGPSMCVRGPTFVYQCLDRALPSTASRWRGRVALCVSQIAGMRER